MSSAADAEPPAPGQRYAYRASLIGSAMTFALTADGLAWHAHGRNGLWPYREIAAIRLSYRPVWMQVRRFRADITARSGATLRVLSTTKQTSALVLPQDADYSAFIRALHDRLAKDGGDVKLTGGLSRRAYGLCAAALAAVMLGLALLLLRAIGTAEIGGALFIAGFAALFVWQVGGFIRRNRPRRYRVDALPRDLLPEDLLP